MKFLELPELDVLSRALALSTPTLRLSTRLEAYSCKPVSRERKLNKTLDSTLLTDLSLSTSVSPPEDHKLLMSSAFGPLDQRGSRKIMWDLIGLLNLAFPDHDFSRVRPEEFKKEANAQAVLRSLSNALDGLRESTEGEGGSGRRSVASYPPSTSFAFPSSPFLSTSPPLYPHTLSGSSPTVNYLGLPHSSPATESATSPLLHSVLNPIIDLSECEVYSYTPDMDSDPHAAESDQSSDEDEGGWEGDSGEEDGVGNNGMVWEMDGVDGQSNSGATSVSSGNKSNRNSSSRARTRPTRSSKSIDISAKNYFERPFSSHPPSPMKSFASFLNASHPASPSNFFSPYAGSPVPGTPTTDAGTEAGDAREDEENYFRESSTGGLLWSSNYFLFNKKMKRILFVSIWARRGGVSTAITTERSATMASNRRGARRSAVAKRRGGGMRNRSNSIESLKPAKGHLAKKRERERSGSVPTSAGMGRSASGGLLGGKESSGRGKRVRS